MGWDARADLLAGCNGVVWRTAGVSCSVWICVSKQRVLVGKAAN